MSKMISSCYFCKSRDGEYSKIVQGYIFECFNCLKINSKITAVETKKSDTYLFVFITYDPWIVRLNVYYPFGFPVKANTTQFGINNIEENVIEGFPFNPSNVYKLDNYRAFI